MKYIRNPEQLISHGNASLRSAAIEIIEAALEAADPYTAVDQLVHLEGEILTVGESSFDLTAYERIFILGAGKASRGVAQALEEKLGDRIYDGLFILKYGDEAELEFSRVLYASHPLPDGNSLHGAKSLMEMAESLTERDLVFAGITGGSSALLSLPVPGISLQDLQRVNELLLLSGADIRKINAVRKHLSMIKGGWFAEKILPATLINLTVSDVVGDALDYITGPTVPDTSTFDDAREVLDEFDLWDSFPLTATEYLRSGSSQQETPKDFGSLPLHSFVVVPGDAACVGAYEHARKTGFNSMILTTRLGGEAEQAGSFLSSIAHEVISFGRPLLPPCAVIVGGENVVSIGDDDRGLGGPNQEFALSAAMNIVDLQQVLIASIDTDGSDGPTDVAGAMVGGSTIHTARAKGWNPSKVLRSHDSYSLLCGIGDAVFTGATGTNVNDLKLLLVEDQTDG